MTTRHDNTDPGIIYASDRQLAKRYGVHRTAIWRWVRNGDLPAPLRLSPGCTRWKMADILEHEAALRRA